jgi:hypothetical protein
MVCMQTISVGGNQRARQYFKQNGWSELGTDKIEQKVIAVESTIQSDFDKRDSRKREKAYNWEIFCAF